MKPQLLRDLVRLCREGGSEPDCLLAPEAEDDPLLPVLQQSIVLRDSGQPALSLSLLEQAEAGGLRSGWLLDNRARALLLLQRRDEAKALWHELRDQEDQGFRVMAAQQLKQLEVEERLPQLWPQLQTVAAQHRWAFQCLSEQQIRYAEFEFALLEEVVLAREQGAVALSLALVNLAMELGFESGWLRENKARACLAQDNVLEACRIWRELEATCDQQDVRSAAAAMLHSCRRQEQSALAEQREHGWITQSEQLAEGGDLSSAIHRLVQGLVESPDSGTLESSLLTLLDQRRTVEDAHWNGLSPWLRRCELNLELNEVMLQAFEQRLPD